MRNNRSIKIGLAIGIITLFILSALTPIAFGYDVKLSNKEVLVDSYNFDRYLYPEYYDCYNIDEVCEYVPTPDFRARTNYNNIKSEGFVNPEEQTLLLDGPMDSPWPMYCYDTRHTSRSPYNTVDNPGIEKWRCALDRVATGGIAIDNDGILYIGSDGIYAIYPNGTLKWKFDTDFKIVVTPTIDENGIIYAGTIYATPNCLYALYSNNGTLKWKYCHTGSIYSSPAISDDGTIYFGSENLNPDIGILYALYPNGTLKWEYRTDHVILSSPAIGDDGIVYVGSHDTYLHAVYPNGTLKWKYGTGHWIRTSPCIADDGTIYVVSLDNYLHAVYPNGTMKWKTNVGAGTSPTIGQDGTVYAGYNKLHAVNPTNGSVKWMFDVGGKIRGATPCNSIDGMIYFGTHIGESDGGELIAVNPDGTEKWRIMVATDWIDSAPVIGNDGAIYAGSWNDLYHPGAEGYLHAFGALDPDAPSAPDINGPTSGNAGTEYDYTFKATSPLERDVYYYVDWGDNTVQDWIGPYISGEEATLSHKWSSEGTYTIKARAKDTDNLWGPWGELEVSMPRNKATSNVLFFRFLEQFPNAFPILRHLL